MARWMAHPDRRTEDENVGIENLPSQGRPLVAVTLVRRHPRRTLRSAIRTGLVATPWEASAASTSPSNMSLLEASFDDLSEQFRANALSVTAGVVSRTGA